VRYGGARLVRTVAIAAVLALTGAACDTAGDGGAASPAGEPQRGGQAVFGAEQWPQCVNPITSCAFASWYAYTVQFHTMPRLLELDTAGNFIAGDMSLATEVPSLENGMITEDPFTVTFNIKDEAVWEDGSPITSEDIDFTWKAILNTRGAISTTGYDQIKSIDTSDPKTAVIEFTEPYVDWPDLFGGALQFVLKKDAFPQADEQKPDLSEEMLEEVPFSGGPWILDSWNKQEAVLLRTDPYWGPVPLLDQVTFVRRQNQTTELNSLKSGEISAIYPQPSNVSLLDQVADTPAIQTVAGDSPYWEALHFNHEAPPLNDPAVREAMLYATNRQAVVDTIIKLNNPEAEVLNCFGWLPPVGEWCDETDFAQFTYQPQKSIEILEGAGYDCSGVPDSPCEKDGEPLSIEFVTTAGNDRRADTQALLKEAAKPAGFDLQTKVEDATFLFSNILPKGDYQMTEFAFGGSPDPSVTAIMACDQIPTQENGFSGQNTDRWCNEQATDLMHQSDRELDSAQRLDLIRQIGDYTVQDFVGVPLYLFPQPTAWRADKIAGPIGEYNETIYSSFYNMNEWYLVSQ
jgi:peptide/nickel transport system substrate-binding protein